MEQMLRRQDSFVPKSKKRGVSSKSDVNAKTEDSDSKKEEEEQRAVTSSPPSPSPSPPPPEEEDLMKEEEKKEEAEEEVADKDGADNEEKKGDNGEDQEEETNEVPPSSAEQNKVANLLGLTDDEYTAVKALNCEMGQDESSKENNAIAVDRERAAKALVRLGVDPSRSKALAKLGLSDAEVQELKQDILKLDSEAKETERVREHIQDRCSSAKALEILGLDLCKTKVMKMMGLSEEEMQQAQQSITKMLAEKPAIKTDLNNVDTQKATKALAILGVDPTKPSQDKIKNRLGLSDAELTMANEEAKRQAEEQHLKALEECRIKERIQNRKQSAKALKVLGVDPSTSKATRVLGVTPDQLSGGAGGGGGGESGGSGGGSGIKKKTSSLLSRRRGGGSSVSLSSSLEASSPPSSPSTLKREGRTSSTTASKRNVSPPPSSPPKALSVLGVDPSEHKLMDKLGMTDADLCKASEWKAQYFEEKMEQVRQHERIADRKHTAKALAVLGADPSRKKIVQILGLTEADLDQAELYLSYLSSQHDQDKKTRDMESLKAQDRKQISKALSVLGVDLSKHKASKVLGEDLCSPSLSEQPAGVQ